jgi:2-hydroxychromene-2-carboxylate isomerase
MPTAGVDFYFNYGCPWTYLASVRLREAALRTAARIAWKPILVARVQERVNAGRPVSHAPPVNPARARYAVKDLADWAAFCGVEIRRPGPFPVRADWAVRGAVVAAAEGAIEAFSERVFAACFAEGEDIDSPDVVSRIAVAAGLDAEAFRQRLGATATQVKVEELSDELLARGGFGSPTMFVGGDMYFGNDRMPLVELALSRSGERPLVAPGAHGQI